MEERDAAEARCDAIIQEESQSANNEANDQTGEPPAMEKKRELEQEEDQEDEPQQKKQKKQIECRLPTPAEMESITAQDSLSHVAKLTQFVREMLEAGNFSSTKTCYESVKRRVTLNPLSSEFRARFRGPLFSADLEAAFGRDDAANWRISWTFLMTQPQSSVPVRLESYNWPKESPIYVPVEIELEPKV
jgi:hypothetical protein